MISPPQDIESFDSKLDAFSTFYQDRLDAFLCVECGYCASGGFSFEITAGLASKAIAIIDEVCHLEIFLILYFQCKLNLTFMPPYHSED